MSGDYVEVRIPRTLYNRIREYIKNTGFKDVSQFVTYVLREFLSSMETGESEIISREDRERIIEKLKRLGYL